MNELHRSCRTVALILPLILGLVGCTQTTGGRPPGAPTSLRTNDVVNPVGTGADVHFGWLVNDPDSNEIQSKYQVLVASTEAALKQNTGDLWDSGPVESRQQNHIAYSGKPLSGDTQVFWKVRTWDKDGAAGPYSAAARFVVGPIDNPGWAGANWIWSQSTLPDEYTYYRKKAALPNKPVARATVYISTAHKYALYLNGTLVGKGPAYHYPQYQYYNGYDVTKLISPSGQNVFAIFNHWFGAGQGRPGNARGVILKAVVHHTDGTTTVIGTDGSWVMSPATAWIPGQQQQSGEGIGYVERIDAARLIPDWFAPNFDDSAWTPAAVAGPHPTNPWTGVLAPDLTRITEIERTPASIADKGNGRYIVDLGKVYAAIPKITFSGGQAGTVVNMQAGYGLTEDGEINPRRNQSARLQFATVLSGNTFTFQPAEYYGFRYLQVENSPMPITTGNFKFIDRHNTMDPDVSSFMSSNEMLNNVWEFMKHSLFTCAQEEFVDTPTREKGGFLGDGAIQSTVAMPVLNERLLTQRTINEFLQSMDQFWSTEQNRGRMNAVYPNNDGGRDIPDFTQAYLLWVWDYYMHTGDKRFLEKNYGKFKDIAEYLVRHIDPNTGLVTRLTGGSGQYVNGIIDWPAQSRYGYDMQVAARAVINGWAVADFQTVSRIAAELGNTADRDAYHQRAEAIKSAINAKLINADGVYIDGLAQDGSPSAHVSQHANMFPLAQQMVPAANLARVTEKIKELKMSVGMVTVMWLVKALGEADQGEHLIELYTNPEWHGWARCLSRGATATWETWTSDTDGTSESHAWGAAGLYGYVHYILGITPLKPQFEDVRIKPLDFGTKLTRAKGSIPTDRGTLGVEWTREAGRYTLRVTIPANVSATVYVPRGNGSDAAVQVNGESRNGTIEGDYIAINGIGSGTHTFVRTVGQ